MIFKTWSENNQDALKELKPNLGLFGWNDITEADKQKIWKYLEIHFFSPNSKKDNSTYNNRGSYFEFYDDEYKSVREDRIFTTIKELNNKYKSRSYGEKFLYDKTLFNACVDFYEIFLRQSEHVVLEMLSIYCLVMSQERMDLYRNSEDINDEEYYRRNTIWKWEPFEEFAKDLNEVFLQFNLNYYLTSLGWTSRQEERVIQEIYEPTIRSLANERWKEVNQHLTDAFNDYSQNTPQGYSSSVTNTISAVQAFLQITVLGKTGKGDIGELLKEAQKQKLIPNDTFTETIFRDVQGFLMRQRQETGNAHPKKEYATEMNARLVLNLSMVFFQHCIQHKHVKGYGK